MSGPNILLDSSEPYSTEIKFRPSKIQPIEDRLSRKIVMANAIPSSHFQRFSSYVKLIQITSWCLRFQWNAHWFGPRLSGPLATFEIQQTVSVLLQGVQKEHFRVEINKIQNRICLDRKDMLAKLSPFIDTQGLIRLGGRLSNAEISFDQRFPIFLPNDRVFTRLLVKYEHKCHFHVGSQLLRSVLTRQFQILRHRLSYSVLHSQMCEMHSSKG